MEFLSALLPFAFIASFVAGIIMLCTNRWRSSALRTFAYSGVAFLGMLLLAGGIEGLAAIAVFLSVVAFVVGVLMLCVKQWRYHAKQVLKISSGAFVASVAATLYVLEPTDKAPTVSEVTEKQSVAPEPKNETPILASPKPETKTTTLERPSQVFAPSKTTSVIQNGKTMYVDASRLNVRNGPSKSHKVIWTLKDNEEVLVVELNGDWSLLRGKSYQGWVFSTYLTPKPSRASAIQRDEPSTQTVNTTPSITDAQIAKILIRRSQAYYSGSCPCPYSRARNGSKCGGRSAYSRPGGASPLCYRRDITPQMIADYRARQ